MNVAAGIRKLCAEEVILPLCRRAWGPASAKHSLHQSDTFTGQAQKSQNAGAVFSRACC